MVDIKEPAKYPQQRHSSQDTGGFAFKNVTQGSLASKLGFQENDVPLTVNGHDVQTLEDVLATLSALYDDTALTVRIQRGSTIVTQNYLIQ